MEAIKAKALIGPSRQLIWLEPIPPLSEGLVEVILLYPQTVSDSAKEEIAGRPQFGSAKGLIKLADDFDTPLADFQEYMA